MSYNNNYDFFENITLGLIDKLRNLKNVHNVAVEKRAPCNRLVIAAWEHSHNVILPEDLKEFYSSTDGFKLTWNYNNNGNKVFDGDITINSLSMLYKLGSLSKEYGGNWIELLEKNSFPNDKRQKRDVFILNDCPLVGKICLVYHEENKKYELPTNSIWLLDTTYRWHLLSSTFMVYFRMALVHMGIPQWQFRFSDIGLTCNTKQIILMLAPEILKECKSSLPTYSNQLNPNVFKINAINYSSDYVPESEKHLKNF